MVLFCLYLRPDLDMIFILVACNNLLTLPINHNGHVDKVS